MSWPHHLLQIAMMVHDPIPAQIIVAMKRHVSGGLGLFFGGGKLPGVHDVKDHWRRRLIETRCRTRSATVWFAQQPRFDLTTEPKNIVEIPKTFSSRLQGLRLLRGTVPQDLRVK